MADTKRTRRPTLAGRASTTPLSPSPRGYKQAHLSADPLTPPASPIRRVDSSDHLVEMGRTSMDSVCGRGSIDSARSVDLTSDGILACPYNIDLTLDNNGEPQIFGYGAWSTVFKGSCCLKPVPSSGLMTPPTRKAYFPPLFVAIKSPARKDAVDIIRSEAKILTHLRDLDQNEHHVAAFHGLFEDTSLVLEAHPLSLEDHIKSCAQQIKTLDSSTSRNAPVLGNINIWLSLADKLIDTLDWMQNTAQVVHGDIKPGNILLRPNRNNTDEFSYQPLCIDFSSSQRLDDKTTTPNTLSAVTKEYTAPELLTVAVMKDPNSCATTGSDVFSLGVTLLVAATGDIMVYPGCSPFQRQVMATQGNTILSNVRNFSMRVPRHGVVGKVLEKAFLKKDLGRTSTTAWKNLVDATKRDLAGQTKAAL